MQKTSKINPNSFFTIACEWVRTDSLTGKDLIPVEITRKYNRITSMEKIENESGNVRYFLYTRIRGREATVQYVLTEEAFLKLRSQLEQVDFNVPIIETQEQIKETVKDVIKEEMNKKKTINPILSLEV